MANEPAITEFERLRLERDLYLGLLGLSHRDDPGAFLEEALGLIVRILNAQQGYLEVSDPNDGPTSWRSAGCSDAQVEVIQTIVSRGIIAEALALGDVVSCPSAILDPRFRDRPSVQASNIEAVLCVPILCATPVGVLYLQGRAGRATFADQEVDRARLFARHLAPLVESLFIRSRQRQADHVAPFRKRLLLGDIVGTSAALAGVLREVELVSPLDVSVLITGETGTGKSQLARAIHDNGPRRGRPFMAINCSAFPDTLLESELFGAAPGSFTGATRRIEGKIAAAQGGTIFLDEVGEMSQAAQSKLLTFLDTREYSPLGAAKPVTADVRVIAATNTNLEVAMREKRFRNDLFYRLQVLRIRIPTLAERPEDILPLATHLCERAVKAHRLSHLILSPGALRALEAAAWEGNVRELAKAIETAAIRAAGDGATAIEAKHLFGDRNVRNTPTVRPQLTFQEETRRFQSDLVLRTLESVDWRVSEAARTLDLTKAHIYNLIRAFGLTRRPRAS